MMNNFSFSHNVINCLKTILLFLECISLFYYQCFQFFAKKTHKSKDLTLSDKKFWFWSMFKILPKNSTDRQIIKCPQNP